MPFEAHQEKAYSQDAQSIYKAGLKATEKLGGKIISSTPDQLRFEARFPKVILGKTPGERTQLACAVRAGRGRGTLLVDALPLHALGRKLMFGAPKRLSQTIVPWLIPQLENTLGHPP